MTIQTWLENSTNTLLEVNIDSARLDSLILLEDTLKSDRSWLLAHGENEISALDLTNMNKKILQRIKHIPLAYIIGSKEFYGRDFMVNKYVLIPRPDSEAMIELLIKVGKGWDSLKVLDIGTGSGCLAITAQLELPNATVTATDISPYALKIAHLNAEALGAPIQFYEANLLSTPTGVEADVVLANLPYVPDGLITSEEIKQEPKLALFSGKAGMNHYKIFWQQVANLEYLPSYIFTECLKEQHQAMKQLAHHSGYTLENTKDLVQQFKFASRN